MPDRIPLFPLGTVLFPGAPLPLHVFEERYRALVADLLAAPEPRSFGVVAIRAGHEVGADNLKALYDVGCLAVVQQIQRHPDGRFALLAVGAQRFRVHELDRSRPYLQADVTWLDEPLGDDTVDEAASAARAAFDTYAQLRTGAPPPALPDDPAQLAYSMATAVADLPLEERQTLLEALDTADRLRTIARLLTRETALLRELRSVPLPTPPLPRSGLN